MEKKLFAIECGNVALVVRPNGDTVIVTEATELVLDNTVMEQIVRNSGAYKDFCATKDDALSTLEYENTNLQNKIAGLKEDLKHTEAAKNKLQQELDNVTKPLGKGCIVNIGNLAQGTLGHLFDINGDFIVDCETDERAKRVQYLLQEGKVNLDMVMEIFGDTGDKKTKAASGATLEDFNWDNTPTKRTN